MTDFNFEDYASEVSTFAKVVSAIEATGRKVVVQGDQMVAVNEHNEVSYFSGIVEHAGEVCLTIPRTKWYTKVSGWLTDANVEFAVERTGPDTDYRVYVS